ncbi:MAG: RNA polymerase sigma factor [Acidimicrobiales bacterium]
MALRQEEFTSLCDDVDLDRDRVLVERCQAGDSGAFGNLYARYYERLLRFCLRRLNDRHEAEDAAQEAFARAWKALPQFAGERRFYPWLTVIAGNICTDMLRRRSRSTPTDDLELSAHQPVGGSGSETSDELILAAVDGELVNKALGRLSDRHRQVLAMREGSGWTYQQIADHEGVEIGTIETLLWRARQALKREFTVLSESKGMLGGFLAGAGTMGALLRRGFLRAAHRSAALQQSGGSGGFRNALAGVAFTSAAVAAALITPHALSGTGASGSTPGPALAAANIASPALGPTTDAFAPLTSAAGGVPAAAVAGAGSTTSTAATATATSAGALGTTHTAGAGGNGGSGGSGGGGGGLIGGAPSPSLPGSSGLTQTVAGASGAVSGLTNQVTTTVSQSVSNVLNQALPGIGNVLSDPAPSAGAPSSSSTNPVAPVTKAVTKVLNSIPGL